MTGQFVPATQYLKAQRARQVLAGRDGRRAGRGPRARGAGRPLETPPLDMREVTVNGVTQDVRLWITRCTAPINVTGHPVLAVPCG